jgi:hypothetical protein
LLKPAVLGENQGENSVLDAGYQFRVKKQGTTEFSFDLSLKQPLEK